VLVPTADILRYLGGSPRLHRTRTRAIAVCAATFTGVFAFLFLLPFPHSFKAAGVLKSTDYVVAVNKASGQVAEVITPSGERVSVGDPLLRLTNSELALEIRESQAGLDEAKAQHRKAMRGQQADLGPIANRIAFYQKRLRRLREDQGNLVVKSEVRGIWVAPNLADRIGMWINRGSPLGELIDDDQFYFVSVVPQADVSELFAQGVRKSEVKLAGQAGVPMAVTEFATIPMEQTHLPSVALGYAGGGDIAIDTRDAQGVKTSEPYYQVRAFVQSRPEVSLLHGRSGRIRFSLAPKSLAWQGWRELRQLLQKRYQL
jgi:putative peptide zinc metalloprotease protein